MFDPSEPLSHLEMKIEITYLAGVLSEIILTKRLKFGKVLYMLKRQPSRLLGTAGEVPRRVTSCFLKSKLLAFCIVLHLFAATPLSSLDLFINTLNIH